MKTKLSFHLVLVLSLLLAVLPIQTTQAAPAAASTPADLLQFTAGGHVLGFAADGMYVATGSHALHVDFAGANATQPHAESAANSDDQAAALGKVTYTDLWDGIRLTYSAEAGSIYTTTYNLAPGANPADIRLCYNTPLSMREDGSLNIAFETGSLTESAPIAWQQINGRRVSVETSFHINNQEVSFTIGSYNPGYALTIDPSLVWNTFLGGNGTDTGSGIAVDGNGNVYVTGYSNASWGSPLRAYKGTYDAYAAKFNSAGALTWNTFLGGSSNEYGTGIAVDGSGNVYISGYGSNVWGSPVRGFSGGIDAFAAKISSSGVLTWNTFLGGSSTTGGSSDDYGLGIAVDTSGNVFVTGYSDISWGFPVQAFTGSSLSDAFAAKLSSSGVLTWNTFLGGISSDYGKGIAVDGSGNAYVTGYSTISWGSPLRAFTAGHDAFAAKLNAIGGLTWNTFLGGSGTDEGTGIVVDNGGNVYVTGQSNASWGCSPNACTLRAYTGSTDAFAVKLSSSGVLTWNTFLGGIGGDFGTGLRVDGSGNVYVIGYSNVTWGSPVQPLSNGYDAFAAKLNSSGALTWNTFLGGNWIDYGYGIAVDGSGNIYLAGRSYATWGSPVIAFNGDFDAFASKFNSSGALTWNTFMGGSGTDYAKGIAVDASGNVYVTGYSTAPWGSPVRNFTDSYDAFAAKLDSAGALTWNTFMGGGGIDRGLGIAVDGAGNVYMTGYSTATWGSPERLFSSGFDAFAAKLDSSGELLWNTFLGGSGYDQGSGIALYGSANVYVTGYSNATWGSPARAYNSDYDAFVAKLDLSGELTWNTFLGGAESDFGNGIAVDLNGNVFVTGYSHVTWGSPLRLFTNGYDAFAAKLDSSGALLWNAFLGGNSDDFGTGITVDHLGHVLMTGYSYAAWGCSPTACTLRAFTGSIDAFVAKLDSTGTLIWNTFLGGWGEDYGTGISLDGDGNIYVTGYSNLPWSSPVRVYTSGNDAFAAKLDSSGAFTLNTFLGGSGNDYGYGITLDENENVFVTGYSDTSWGSPLRACSGLNDAFAAKVDVPPTVVSSMRANLNPNSSDSVDFIVTFSEMVTGVNAGDFALNLSGVTGASITGVSGSGTTYTVTVNTGDGNGTIRLDVLDDNSIQDVSGNTLHGEYTGGQTYTITKEFTLTIISAHGTVTVDPDQDTYHEGDVVELTATPDSDWTFANWTGDLTSYENPESVTIYGNTTVTANYTQDVFSLSITSAHGTVARNPDQATYHEGDVVQLTATPSLGWTFANWTGGLTGSTNPGSVTIHGSTSVTANYTQNAYSLTITSAHGTVARNPDQATYHEGDVVQLTATPSLGWTFSNWTGGLTGSANPGSVTIHGNTAITANYLQNGYSLTITSAHGTVARNPDQATYHEGDVVQLTATPSLGWTFANWTGGLTGSANPGSVTIHGSTSVTANYTQNAYSLTITSAHGTVARNPDQATYHEGDVVQLTATPSLGWTFSTWTGGLTGSANPGAVTVHGNTSVTANYTQNGYSLTITSAHGTVARNPDQATYHEGDVVQLTATPSLGWTFSNWTGGLSGTTSPGSVTIHGNTAVTANYTQNAYSLTITSAHGTIARNPDQATYHEGDVVQLTATPSLGWTFSNWTGGLTGSANPGSVTIHGNTAVTANYTQNVYSLTITSAHGTVARNPDQATYHEGDVVQLTATPSLGWTFSTWTGGLTGSTNPGSVTIHGNTAVTANYLQNGYSLTITSAHGTVTRNPDQAAYHEGDVVQLTATPSLGWTFSNWTGGLTGSANPGSVTIHGNTSVTANYTQNGYSLTITSAHGTVARNPNQATYHEGDVVQLTATPSLGWTFSNWTGGLTGSANPGSVTIHGNTAITANYLQNGYSLTITSAHGTVTRNPDQAAYHEGDVVQLTVTPDLGWTFANWSGGLTGSTNPGSVTIHANTSVTANYTQACYTLTRTHTGSGSDPAASPANSSGCSSGQYHPGESIELTASPAAGWAVESWSGTNNDTSTSTANTLSMPSSNSTITTNYTQICYVLTLTHTGTGSTPTASPANSSGCSSGRYHFGETISLTASPAAGWAVGSWSGTSNDTSTSTTNSLSMPLGSRTVTANYILNDTYRIYLPLLVR